MNAAPHRRQVLLRCTSEAGPASLEGPAAVGRSPSFSGRCVISFVRSHPLTGFLLGLALILAALIRVPSLDGAQAETPAAAPHCPVAEVSLDQGYGVTRRALQPVCDP